MLNRTGGGKRSGGVITSHLAKGGAIVIGHKIDITAVKDRADKPFGVGVDRGGVFTAK